MKEEAERCRVAGSIGDGQEPTKGGLCDTEGLRIRGNKEHKGAVQGVFGFKGHVRAGVRHLLRLQVLFLILIPLEDIQISFLLI